ncbi:ester cyclase [Streptomyces sp. NPDC002680]|uniref:ester cyclase n=1 Tax=Streptomyces sp. NPDC002680 TaxID=3364659 RepID=UPI0036A9A804
MTDSRSTKDTARSFYESYNDRDLDASFEKYVSTGLVNHVMGGTFDRAAWLTVDKTLFPAFEDFTFTVLDQVAEESKVATRYRLGGTHTGEFSGIPASGKTAFLTGTAVDRVADGRIVEHWADLDFTGFLQQLTDGAPAGTGSTATTRTTDEELRRLADEHYRLANAHDLDELVALHAPDFVSHEPQGDVGIEWYREVVGAFFAAFPDATLTPVNTVVDGDRLVLHFETVGTHTGADFFGIPAAGKKVRFTEIRVRRIEDGRFAEHWGLYDQATVLGGLQ